MIKKPRSTVPMKPKEIKISMDEGTVTHIVVDGVEERNVVSFVLRQYAHGVAVLELNSLLITGEASGKAEVGTVFICPGCKERISAEVLKKHGTPWVDTTTCRDSAEAFQPFAPVT